MTASPFQKIVFPAILASSAVFASLTVPLASVGGSPAAAPLPGPIKQWFSPLLQHEQKKVSIRYIGFSIISSVVAGVGTAEIMRLNQNRQQRSYDLLQLLTKPEPESSESFFAADFPAEITPESDEATWGTTQPLNWLDGLAQEPLPGWPSARWDEPSKETHRSLFTASPSHPWHISDTPQAEIQPDLADRSAVAQSDSFSQALSSDQAGEQPCRIQLPGSDQRVLAMEVEGEYYSFFRLRPTREQALAMVNTLAKRGESAIVTPHAKGHVVWVKQTQAKADKSTWEQWQMIA
ncbi:hypothetical protein [Pseudanabaena sp. FACHB-2040]|uniref:hypothetical protein n=1 Tax=Pseudanabaena sp. FACHB-2040 TaxID=2692859 RepID=UPI001681D7AE|nr:hypothetical protein [Pseudanabaena sp. FACHB-2040]MBD2258031.1 hypothetical protein [Pseudanabaena sp. FACHB-2040]